MANIKKIIEQAERGFEIWSEMPLSDRVSILDSFAKIVDTHKDKLAHLISKEVGKPLWESKTEVSSVSAKIQISIESFKMRYPENIRTLSNARSITRHKPHGTCVVLGPFNFPLHLPNGHIIPALLAGNSILFKPSELAPETAALYMSLWEKAKLPKHVLQLVEGGPDAGKKLLEQDVQGVFFTGSLKTGLEIHKKFAERPDVIVALELGGNNALIVSQITDIHAASYLTIQSCYITSGQRCTAARRLILVDSSLSEAYLKELSHMIKTIKVGMPTDKPEPFMGPVISSTACGHIINSYEHLISLGGKPLNELERLKEGSNLLSPALIDMTGVKGIPDEEIFGPLLQVHRVASLSDAIALANSTKYGLSAGLFSDSYTEYEVFFNKIKAGIINWNTPLTGASSHAPFGGVKMSGNHRPSAFYAADYSAYPVASMEASSVKIPTHIPPGILGVKK